MKRILLKLSLLLSVCLLSVACYHHSPTPAAEQQAPQQKTLAGGWKANPKAINSQAVRQAAEAAAFEISQGASTHYLSIDHLESQVVAGMNYRFQLTLEENTRWFAEVYRDLSGHYHVRAVQALE